MKPLTCDMCGSTNLIKQDGVFVCQSCGTKYSLEEAKKMMVEGTVSVQGTVKIDNSDEAEKYLVLARNANEAGNFQETYDYSTKVLETNPQNAEAWFLKMKGVSGIGKVGAPRIQEVISAGKNAASFEKEMEVDVCKFFLEHANGLLIVGSNMAEDSASIQKLYASSFRAYGKQYAITNCTNIDAPTIETIKGLGDGAIALFYAASGMESFKMNDIQDLAAEVRKKLLFTFSFKLSQRMLHYWHPQEESVSEKYRSEGEQMLEVLPKEKKRLEDLAEDRRLHPEKYKSTSTSSKGGCYVATAVYGSYDCPQVWTLRRYRDYTLAEKWQGRVFVKTYYAISPTLVEWFGKSAWFIKMWRKPLDRIVGDLNNKGVESTPYEDREW